MSQLNFNLYCYRVRVVDIIDGDSVRIDIDKGFEDWKVNQNVRLFGLNAPEIRTRDIHEKEMGYKVKAWVAAKFEVNGEYCIMESYYDKSGKFGRILGTFWLNDEDGNLYNLNELMLNEGLAELYH
jgi:endonuclease YncB( thermonuclease family)